MDQAYAYHLRARQVLIANVKYSEIYFLLSGRLQKKKKTKKK